MNSRHAPFRVQKFLAGLRYPARKHEVIAHAREHGADAQVLRLLVLAPDRDYESPISVSCEVAHQLVGHVA
jgi:hypothetical protein